MAELKTDKPPILSGNENERLKVLRIDLPEMLTPRRRVYHQTS